MLQLKSHVSADDLQVATAIIAAQSKSIKPIWYKALSFYISVLMGGFAYYLINTKMQMFGVEAGYQYVMLLSGILLVVAIIWSVKWSKGAGLKAWQASLAGDYIWELNAEGISLQVGKKTNFFAWSQVFALHESQAYWYVYLQRHTAIIVPKIAINQYGEVDHGLVRKTAQTYWQNYRDNADLILPRTVSEALQQQNFLAYLSQNLLNGFRLAFFLKVNALNFKVRVSQWIALIMLHMATLAFFDYCYYQDAQFNLYGITEYAAGYLLLLLAVLVITRVIVARSYFSRMMVMMLAGVWAVDLVYLTINSLQLQIAGFDGSAWHWLSWGLSLVWVLCVVARVLKSLFNYPLPTLLFLTAIYSFIALGLPGLLTQQHFFIESYKDDYANIETDKIDVEGIYYNQNNLVQTALSALKPERKAVPELYFVGLAGASYQDVFLNEIQYAQKLMDKYFDTAGHSLLLANHRKTINTLALGNFHNLSATLNGLGAKMNKDEDILFLFLSSHGSQPYKNRLDYEISTDFYPFQQNNIEAKQLKVALDASGIKNRVIIVSACHSGGFVDALKDENSLIIAAARKDRSSFGCAEDAKYTYFGEAYFLQSLTIGALKGDFSFTHAFANAQKLVRKKEQTEQKGELASEPQMFEGAAIRQKLVGLETRLKTPKT